MEAFDCSAVFSHHAVGGLPKDSVVGAKVTKAGSAGEINNPGGYKGLLDTPEAEKTGRIGTKANSSQLSMLEALFWWLLFCSSVLYFRMAPVSVPRDGFDSYTLEVLTFSGSSSACYKTAYSISHMRHGSCIVK